MEKVVKELLKELQYIETHYNEVKTTGEDFNFIRKLFHILNILMVY